MKYVIDFNTCISTFRLELETVRSTKKRSLRSTDLIVGLTQ